MRRILASLTYILFLPTLAFAQLDGPGPFGYNTSYVPSGVIVIHQGNQTTWSIGGLMFPRTVQVVTRLPEGTDVARFRFPSIFHDPIPAPLPTGAPANLHIQIPDPYGLVYINGELIRGTGVRRSLQSPMLLPGRAYPVRVRATYVVGDQFVIEDREVMVRAAEAASVVFDGTRGVRVPMQKEWVGPPPTTK
ncbi:MAG TPA: hypothetical protein VFE62_02510 [Gemmataceae bacterium]|nr:hypothetical protein [Gemmataceae bacterium]